jgi:hypothetical protein
VGRHHCWAAGPLGLGFPVFLYIVTPSINNTTVHSSTWYQRIRFRVFPHLPLQQPAAPSSRNSRRPPPTSTAVALGGSRSSTVSFGAGSVGLSSASFTPLVRNPRMETFARPRRGPLAARTWRPVHGGAGARGPLRGRGHAGAGNGPAHLSRRRQPASIPFSRLPCGQPSPLAGRRPRSCPHRQISSRSRPFLPLRWPLPPPSLGGHSRLLPAAPDGPSPRSRPPRRPPFSASTPYYPLFTGCRRPAPRLCVRGLPARRRPCVQRPPRRPHPHAQRPPGLPARPARRRPHGQRPSRPSCAPCSPLPAPRAGPLPTTASSLSAASSVGTLARAASPYRVGHLLIARADAQQRLTLRASPITGAVNTPCQVRRMPLPGWTRPAAHPLHRLRWIRRCRGLPGRIPVAATFPA